MLKRILLKLTSTKFVITLWSAVLISYIVINNIKDMNNIALSLCTIPVSYFVVNAVQKKHNDIDRRGEERRYE